MKRQFRNTARGFTLIEIMVTVAILGIITAIAVPAYQAQAQKSRRADAIAVLLDVAAREERFVIDNNVYTTEVSNLATHATTPGLGLGRTTSEKGYYTVTVVLGTAPAPAYTIKATPVSPGAQASDVCGILTVTSTGVRGPSTPANCW